jgi:high-affinity nickel-transport protein
VIADVAERAFGVGLLASAFLLGFRHGIDWDHIAAITDITGSQEERGQALTFGTLYALGHALVVFTIGTVALVLGASLPEGVDAFMGRVVGVTLLVLGVYVVVSLVRHGREFRMRSRWMLIFAATRRAWRRVAGARGNGHELEPVHVHAGPDGTVAVAEDIAVSEWHHGHHGLPGHHHHKHPEPDAFVNYAKGTSFLVGMLHGVGGETPTQVAIFLAVAGVGGKLAGVAVLATFLIGLLGSNTLITIGSSLGFLQASRHWGVYATVAILTAIFSLVLGTLFLLGEEALLPAFFSA